MRYLPHTDTDRSDMLAAIGAGAIDDLFTGVPAEKMLKDPVNLPRRKSELEVARILGASRRKTSPQARCHSSSVRALTSITCRRPSITSSNVRNF